ncbi:hypothetical protein D0C16_08705 [Cellvibrio sp. KY-GH-1]|uniref:hypothetical protein n=1 Tax=Cellvibrio sp. KY-GH-1 TaxID=2303332 RepID=UPI0012484D0B|nr:hypothetical protein [Cellvibrio sp. KY-GH-1]QEY16054.1 hypothetical protein D0C16_08705 [Cellvibrio sp. KY-GH-1]
MNKPSLVKRSFKHLLWFILSFILLFVFVKMGLSLMGTEAEQIETLNRVKHSAWLVWIRYALYALLWFGWRPLLLQLNSKLPEEFISASRRPVIALILMYEIFIARDVIRLISSWIA